MIATEEKEMSPDQVMEMTEQMRAAQASGQMKEHFGSYIEARKKVLVRTLGNFAIDPSVGSEIVRAFAARLHECNIWEQEILKNQNVAAKTADKLKGFWARAQEKAKTVFKGGE